MQDRRRDVQSDEIGEGRERSKKWRGTRETRKRARRCYADSEEREEAQERANRDERGERAGMGAWKGGREGVRGFGWIHKWITYKHC